MGFTLDSVVPWGRSYEEYVAMFGLTEADLKQRILGCGDGPAGFNAEGTRRGGQITSIDPLYAFDTAHIRRRISETYDTVIDQVRRHQGEYVWDAIPSVEALGRLRLSAMEMFLQDFAAGKREERYLVGELPVLSFENGMFDIALSSHFLFLYSDHYSLEFHRQAFRELCRVARDVRVFPLLTLDGRPSPHLKSIVTYLSRHGFHVDVWRVAYEFQRGGNELLQITSV